MTTKKPENVNAEIRRAANAYARAYYRRAGNAEKRKIYTRRYWQSIARKQANRDGV